MRDKVGEKLGRRLRIPHSGVGEIIVKAGGVESLCQLFYPQVAGCQIHRVNPPRRQLHINSRALKGLLQETALKRRVVRHKHAPIQHVTEVLRHIIKGGSINDVRCRNLMNLRIRNIPEWLNEGFPRALDPKMGVQEDHTNFNDPVAVGKPRGLQIHYRVSRLIHHVRHSLRPMLVFRSSYMPQANRRLRHAFRNWGSPVRKDMIAVAEWNAPVVWWP